MIIMIILVKFAHTLTTFQKWDPKLGMSCHLASEEILLMRIMVATCNTNCLEEGECKKWYNKACIYSEEFLLLHDGRCVACDECLELNTSKRK